MKSKWPQNMVKKVHPVVLALIVDVSLCVVLQEKDSLQESLDSYSASSRLRKICSSYACSGKVPTLNSQQTKEDKDSMTVKDKEELTFEYSKRLIALARGKQAENKRSHSESNRCSRKRKASGSRSSHGNGVVKRRRQRLSQSQPSDEETEDSSGLTKALNYEKKQLRADWSQREDRMKLRRYKAWRVELVKTAPMDTYEFSRRLAALSRKKNKRYEPHEHAHCCRCVQSFECFWPRSNLQTIRRQAFC
jgi:hypothetical protein